MPVSMLSTSLFSDRKSYSRFNALDTIYTPPSNLNPGMVLMKASSISNSGGTATLGTNGQVTFSGVASVSLNDVFSSAYDNYIIVLRGNGAVGADNVEMQLRASGSDATATNYTRQILNVVSSSVTGVRATNLDAFILGFFPIGNQSGILAQVYGPYLTQPTACRGTLAAGGTDVSIRWEANTHSLSTSYDGCTIRPARDASGSTTISGTLAVYGIRS